MKKSTVKWIALGALATGVAAFVAGVAYGFRKLQKIEAEDEELTEELDFSPEDSSDPEI